LSLKSFTKSRNTFAKEYQTSDEFWEEIRKRIVNAYLPAIIMTRIAETSITSPADIISVIKSHYNLQMSPGTVYPVLYKLEMGGYIKRMPKKSKTIFLLTFRGLKTIDYYKANYFIIDLTGV
jgi:hypothetical protein